MEKVASKVNERKHGKKVFQIGNCTSSSFVVCSMSANLSCFVFSIISFKFTTFIIFG